MEIKNIENFKHRSCLTCSPNSKKAQRSFVGFFFETNGSKGSRRIDPFIDRAAKVKFVPHFPTNISASDLSLRRFVGFGDSFSEISFRDTVIQPFLLVSLIRLIDENCTGWPLNSHRHARKEKNVLYRSANALEKKKRYCDKNIWNMHIIATLHWRMDIEENLQHS